MATPPPNPQMPNKIGPYPIERELGRGGMGVVYLGRDTRLNRQVAIKVLPEEVARDPMRLSRFEREARTLAALNHRNVGLIYGLEQVGEQRLLVLEFVPGLTLTQRLARGAMPLDEALKVCSQVAEGLEAAHEREVVHRDLKPDNIKVAPDGTVKILDFGLATTAHGGGGAGSDDATTIGFAHGAGHGGGGGMSNSTLTQYGMVMGTPGYMSPEQARGFPIDKRTDIWAFGCVLYECLTGLRAFSGPTPSDMLVAVIEREADLGVLPHRTPERVRDLLRKCLVKDTRRRLRDVGDARIELEEALDHPGGPMARGGGGAAGGFDRPRLVARLNLPIDSVEGLACGGSRPSISLSPDGSTLAMVLSRPAPQRAQIVLRRLDQSESRPLEGSDGAEGPFFSPDGQRLGFFADGKLKVVSLIGSGAPVPLAPAARPQGGAWGPDDFIYFVPDWQKPLLRVPSAGGAIETVAQPDLAAGELAFLAPEVLPSGSAVLVSVWTGAGHDQGLIAAVDLRSGANTGTRRPLIEGGSNPRYCTSGHVVFTRGSALVAAPMNLDRLELAGPAAVLSERVLASGLTGAAEFTVGGHEGEGVLCFAPGEVWEPKRTLLVADRHSQQPPQPLTAEAKPFVAPAASPDGAKLAVQIQGPTDHIWLIDLARQSTTRLTFHGDNQCPVWSPDGPKLAIRSNISGHYELYVLNPASPGAPAPVVGGEGSPIPEAFTPDGKSLVYSRTRATGSGGGTEVWIVSLDDPTSARPLVQSQRSAWSASISPDGRTVAFTSDDGGRDDVYLQPMPSAVAAGLPTVGARRLISAETGGSAPLWLRAAGGGELAYRTGEGLVAVRIAIEPNFMVGRPRPMATGAFMPPTRACRNYDALGAGSQFALLRDDEQAARVGALSVVMNWFQHLQARAPRPASSLPTQAGRPSSSHFSHGAPPPASHHRTPSGDQATTVTRPTPNPARPGVPPPPRDLPPGFNDSKTIG